MSKLLVLDAGGVLVSEPIGRLLDEMAAAGGGERQLLDEVPRTDMWAGRQPPEEWMGQLLDFGEGPGTVGEWMERLGAMFAIKPEAERLADWAKVVPIDILSNHRRRWLEPLLDPYMPSLHQLYVSSAIGYAKPEADAFAVVLAGAPDGTDNILYVDDKERNLAAAAEAGMRTLLADEAGGWVAAVDAWCSGGS